jgi:hypothetical protein
VTGFQGISSPGTLAPDLVPVLFSHLRLLQSEYVTLQKWEETFLDIRVVDVSNLGGGWKIRDFCESQMYKKDRKTKEFPRIERKILRDVVRKTVTGIHPVDAGEVDVGG